MDRSIELVGIEDDMVEFILDGAKRIAFSRETPTTALEMFDALDYHPGATYQLGSCEPGEVSSGAFEPIKELIESIINRINALPKDDASPEASFDISSSPS